MLTEQYDEACMMLDALVAGREKILETQRKIEVMLAENAEAIAKATRERDALAAAMSVAPEQKAELSESEAERMKKQTVFLQMRQITNTWIKPYGIAMLTGLDVEEVCAILRRACKIEGVPLEHNGERGQGSMYRWTGEPINK